MVDFTVNANSDVYYSGHYWNDYPTVNGEIFRRISGEPAQGYFEQLVARTRSRTFERALVLNCGNGWVEREMYSRGIVQSVVGVEYSPELVDAARAEASRIGMPAEYHQADINTADLMYDGIDLVINFAAAHHIAYLDRVFRALCRLLPQDGWFFGYDYVGPHRNQYSSEAWEAAWQINQSLPAQLRQELTYPHLPTMLASDPTEAIHSELILDMFRRYFHEEEYRPVGGAIAYPLLTHNDRMWSAPDEERAPWVTQIIEADGRFLVDHPESSLFAYFTGRPNKAALDDAEQLAHWTDEETRREAEARDNGGEYYAHSALASVSLAAIQSALALEHRGHTIAELTARTNLLEAELQAIRASTTYRLASYLAASPPAEVYRRYRRKTSGAAR